MADRIKVTRDQLSEFIKKHNTLRQFEKLFDLFRLTDNNNPTFEELIVGGDPDTFTVDSEGVWRNTGEGTTWDEISQPFIGEKLTSPSSNIRQNSAEITMDFETSARYPADYVSAVIQTPHARKEGSDYKPHFHWVQTQDAIPNILIEYRAYNNGEAVPSVWTLKALTRNVFTYTSGNILQITPFDLPEGFASLLTLSSTFDCRIYRDVTNVSGLFAGADTYSGDWMVKYYDIHFERDMNGSNEEFVK